MGNNDRAVEFKDDIASRSSHVIHRMETAIYNAPL
jgi:hypothetical protein